MRNRIMASNKRKIISLFLSICIVGFWDIALPKISSWSLRFLAYHGIFIQQMKQLAMEGLLSTVLYITQSIVFVPCILLLFFVAEKKCTRMNGWLFTEKKLLHIGKVFLSAIMGFSAAEFVVFCLTLFPEELQMNYSSAMEVPESKSTVFLVLFLIGYVVLGPVTEEIIFREVLFKLLRGSWASVSCIFIISCLFAGTHGNAVQIGYAFLMGILLGLIREHCGSILYTSAFHVAFNMFGTGLFFSDQAIYLMFVGSMIFIVLIVLFVVDIKVNLNRREGSDQSGRAK